MRQFRRPWFNAILAAIVGALLLAGCSLFGPGRSLKSCRYTFQTLDFAGLDSHETHWRVNVGIVNPNPKPISLERMRFALMHENDTLLSGWNPEKKELAPGDSQSIRTNLDLPNAILKRIPAGIWADKDARFLITADAYLDTWMGQITVPGAIHQTIHVNMPEQMAKYRDQLLQKLFSWPRSNPDSQAPNGSSDSQGPNGGGSDSNRPPANPKKGSPKSANPADESL